MQRFSIAMAVVGVLWTAALVAAAEAAPCLLITLTGTQSGPATFNGQAGAGTLISFGDDSNECGTVKLLVDAGRGTNMRLSQLNVTPVQLNAVFFTHMHSDHTEGFADIMFHRWAWDSRRPKLDIVCSGDVASQFGFTVSCQKFVAHIADAFLQSGEIAQRRVEGGGNVRLVGGPAELANLITFKATEEPQVVWSLGDVKVSAIRSTHIPGHASYRVDTPAGSVVVGGDATNDVLTQPRAHSTSNQVELLAKGVDVIVHSTMHPIMGPDRDSGMPPEVFNRQSSTADLGAMAQRVNAKHLFLTHLGPSIGAAFQGAYKVPGGALTAADFRKAAEAGGFTGNIIVGTDLACAFPRGKQGGFCGPIVCYLQRCRSDRASAVLLDAFAPVANENICLVAGRPRRYACRISDLCLGPGLAMKCPGCEHENAAEAKFCEQCGSPMARVCVHCGSYASSAASFCHQCGRPLTAVTANARFVSPDAYTPLHLANKILTARVGLEGERKQVTVLFADIKGSMEVFADRDPEAAQKLFEPVLERMIEAVHHYEGTVNRVMGDGIMALFGAPIAHEDHAVRACDAGLRMQEAVSRYADEAQGPDGVPVTIRVGLNSGEIVICAIGNDLYMDYTVVGQTVNLAARLEQMAQPGSILTTSDTLQLAEGYVTVKALGPMSVKGISNPVQIYEVTGAGAARTRLEVAAGRGLTRFVARDIELQQLRRVQQIAGQGHGQVVGIVGEAGVGKSRLVREFLHSQPTADWLVMESKSASYGHATPYLPIIELLKDYFKINVHDSTQSIRETVTGRILALDVSLQDAIPPLLDLLDCLDDDHPFRSLDLVQRRQSTYQAVVRLLLSESRARPVIAVFEDLHWHDSLSLGLLNELIVATQDARLLLVVNFRPEYKDEWRNRPNYLQLRLDPLASGGLAEFLQAVLGSDESLSSLKSFLVERTSGNPFFVEEIVRRLVDTAVLEGIRGSYRLARPFSSTEVPATVQAVLAARIDALPATAKHLLEQAAVIGHDVPFALLHAICGLAEDQLRGLLDHLQAAEFLYSTQLFPDLQYTFRHSLTHDVTYSGVLHERRREIHARVVTSMEKLYAADRLGEQVERLADHAERGAIWDKALEYLQRSGVKAYSLYANADAVRFFERALTVLKKLPETPDNLRQAVDLRFGLRNALLPLGETDRIGRSLDELDPILASLGDSLRSARYAAFRCNHHFFIGQQRRALEFGQTGVRLARECGDRVMLGELLYRLAQSYYALGEYRQAIELLEQSLEFTPNELRHNRYDLSVIPSVVNRMWLVFAMAECGDFSAGIGHAKRALEIAERAEHPLSEVLGWLSIGHVLLRKGELEGAVSVLERGLDLCDSWSYRLTRPRLASALAVAYARAGRAERGRQLALSAVNDAEQMNMIADKPGLLIRLGQVSLIGGQIEAALSLGTQALEIAVAHEAKGDEAWARFLIGRACWASDPKDIDESEKQLDMALHLAIACEARPLVAFCDTTLCGIHAWRSDQGRAKEFDTAATAIYRELSMQPLPLNPSG